MKTIIPIIYILLTVSLFGFEPIKVGDITILDKTYKNATIVAKEHDGVKVMHDGGPARIKYEILPNVVSPEVLKKIGPFDYEKAQEERVRKQKQSNRLDALVIPKPGRTIRTVEEIKAYNNSLDVYISRLKIKEAEILTKIAKVPAASMDRHRLLKQLDHTRREITESQNSKLSIPISKEEIDNRKK
jgi:hypothetical protein